MGIDGAQLVKERLLVGAEFGQHDDISIRTDEIAGKTWQVRVRMPCVDRKDTQLWNRVAYAGQRIMPGLSLLARLFERDQR